MLIKLLKQKDASYITTVQNSPTLKTGETTKNSPQFSKFGVREYEFEMPTNFMKLREYWARTHV